MCDESNNNLLYIVLTLIFISLSIGSLTYVLSNQELHNENSTATSSLQSISKKARAIEVTATPKLTNLEYEFDITLNTHSTELNYNLVAISSLTNEQGQTVKPSRWEGDGPSGHHRSGKLYFPLFPSKYKILNLTIVGIDGEDIDFKWNL